jgi:TrmH family RNA methyltransferase
VVPVAKTELKKVRSLLTRKGRREHQMFSAEGIRLLEESIRFRFWPRAIYYAPAVLSDRGAKLIKQFKRSHIETKQLTTRELNSISDTKMPQGLVGVFSLPEITAPELFQSRCRRLLLCENISDPGNLGTLIRSALAFGFNVVLLCGSTADPFAPKVVRASAGSVFGLRMAQVLTKALVEFVVNTRMTVIAADLNGHSDDRLTDRKLGQRRFLLAVGSEAAGLSPEILSRADLRVRIRHSRNVESLNAAVAGSILMKRIYDTMN